MTTINTTKARTEFNDTVNRVQYGRERIVLTRRGRPVAVIVPVSAESIAAANAAREND